MPTKNIAAPARRPDSPVRRQVTIRNQQRARRIDAAFLRRIALCMVEQLAPQADVDICLHLVGEARITALNEHFLSHDGSTDVITFDLAEGVPGRLAGEIFVCVPVAEAQAREFHTTWADEVVRYLVHGFLHLMGHDDLEPAPRRRMKRLENQTVRWLGRQFKPGRIQAGASKQKSA